MSDFRDRDSWIWRGPGLNDVRFRRYPKPHVYKSGGFWMWRQPAGSYCAVGFRDLLRCLKIMGHAK